MSVLDRRDVDFLLHTWLKAGERIDRETADAILDLSEKLAAERFLTHFKRNDVEEPWLDDGQVRVCGAIGEALKRFAADPTDAALLRVAGSGWFLHGRFA